MVKGVNKNIIEINDTGSEIFERVIFYISPKIGSVNPKKIMEETEKFTLNYNKSSLKAYTSLRRRMLLKRKIFVGSLLLGSAAVVTGIILLIVL